MNGRLLIWIALGFTLYACYWVSQEDRDAPREDSVASNTQAHKRQTTVNLNSPSVDVRSVANAGMTNLFTMIPNQSNTPISTEPNGHQESAIASAPFVYAGKITDETGQAVFLTDGTQNYVVRLGDSLPDGWRVKTIEAEKLVLLKHANHQSIEINLGAAL